MATSAPESGRERRIGVLGGSFNPPHTGHLVLASQACWQLGLERVLFVPAWSPPHKVIEDRVPAGTRLLLAQAATAGHQLLVADDTEIVHHLRFTVDTLSALKSVWTDAELWFLVGSDSLLTLDTWKDPERLVRSCRLAMALRPGDDPAVVAVAAARSHAVVLDTPPLGISSTDVRRRVRAGAPVTGLVPAAVEALIDELALYRGSMAVGD